MDRIVELSKIKLNTDFTSILVNLVEKGKPVLIEVPANINVWAAYIADNDKLERHFITKEIARPNFSYGYKNRTSILSRNVVAKSVLYAHLIQHVSYVQLKTMDLNVLLKQSQYSIKNALAIFLFDSNGDIKTLCRSSLVAEFCQKNPIRIHRYDSGDTSYERDIEVEFVFSDKSVNKWTVDNRIENDFKDLKAFLDSVYVFEKDVVDFIVKDVDEITSINDKQANSPYHVKNMILNASDLDQLAILGFRYYWGKTTKHPPKVKGLVDLIKNELGYAQKKAEAAAFFLNPNPNGQCGKDKDIATGCQFPYLTYCLERFWCDQNEYNKNITAEIKGFLEKEGFSSDNAKYAELILRPKKFLRAAKKRK